MATSTFSITSLLLIAALTACGSGAGDKCSDFLKGYEDYAQDYIEIAKKAKENPADPDLMVKAASMAADAQKWASKGSACEQDADFINKYAKIQGKITEAVMDM